MNILHLISSRNIFGAERVVLNLVENIQDRNVKSYLGIIDSFTNRNELLTYCVRKNIPHFVIPSRRSLDLQVLSHLNDIVSKYSINIIHSHNYRSDFFSFFLKKKVKWCSTPHGWCGSDIKLYFYELLDKFLIRFSHKIIAVSLSRLKELRNILIPANKIVYIPNWIDVSRFPLVDIKEKLKQPIFSVGVVARLEKEKNLFFTLSVFNKFIKIVNAKAHLFLIGDGSLAASIQRFIEKKKIKDFVSLCGKISAEEIVEFYKKFHCLLLFSKKEGFPMVVLEGMAMGIPIIGSFPALCEVYQKAPVVLVHPLKKEQAISSLLAIYLTYKDYHLFQDISFLLRRSVEKFYNKNLILKRYLDFYFSLVN